MSLLTLMFQMAASSLLSAAGLKTQIGLVTVDVAISTTHSRDAEVMSHPVEIGMQIADHVVLRPQKLEISGFVTDTPLFASGFNLGAARSSATFHILSAMMEARIPFMVLTPRKLYTSMLIERLNIPENREGAIRFECTMVQVAQVFAQNVSLPPTAETPSGSSVSAGSANGGGAAKLVQGNVANPEAAAGITGIRAATTPASPAQQSWLQSLLGGLPG